MDSHTLDKICRSDPYISSKFTGVFSSDELARLQKPKNSFYLIMNTSESISPGRHWKVIIGKKTTANYFCSLGEKPNRNESKFLDQFETVWFNFNGQQRNDEICCGGYCILVLYLFSRGHSFKDIVQFFDFISNDDNLVKYFVSELYNVQFSV